MAAILIIDDEEAICAFLKYLLEKNYEVLTAGTGEKGLNILNSSEVDLVLLDLKLPDSDGISILEQIQKYEQDLPVIIFTAYGSVESAVQAMKLGAFDYINKPFDIGELELLIERALEIYTLRQEVNRLRIERGEKGTGWIIGQNSKMRQVLYLADKVANSEVSVLIQGESGTGKEVVANYIHRRGARSAKPFIALNCAAIPNNLMESELFGFEAGAFTDAKQQKKGLFELANKGTIFLDEIGSMKLEVQAKLLRVLETKTFRRVGGVKDIKTDVRFISATNHNLQLLMQDNLFRQDLYYRLSVIVIKLPPLREQPDNLPLFIAAFIAEFNRAMGRDIKGISPSALQLMRSYPWPGNIRELRNVIERAFILCDGDEIKDRNLPLAIPSSKYIPKGEEMIDLAGDMSLEDRLELSEKKIIEGALREVGGNQSRAAKMLGISRYKLRYRMQKYDLL